MLYNLSTIYKLCENNEIIIQQLLRLTIESIPPDLEALSIAIEKEDWALTAAIAHKMKPVIDIMDVSSIHQAVRQLERFSSLYHPQPTETLLLISTTLTQMIDELLDAYPDLGNC